ELEPEGCDRERDLAAALGIDVARAVDGDRMHAVAVATFDRTVRTTKAVLVDEEAESFLLARAERLVEGHRDKRDAPRSGIVPPDRSDDARRRPGVSCRSRGARDRQGRAAHPLRHTRTAMNDLFSLSGRTALVTGGSRGIGRMIAAGFLRAGCRAV